ncbi:MAG TPA: zinc-dependent metalloprotease family protein [Actinomycetota bacterium]|nr:zinc-dependent metalloprotease family protein [Actinomycetota bacterium]
MYGGRRTGTAISLLCGVLAVALMAPLAGAGPPLPTRIDDAEDCGQPVPDGVAVRNVNDDGQTISLDVLVLLDGVPIERGHEVMTKTAEAYAPLDISLDYRFEEVAFEPEEPATDTSRSKSDSMVLLEDAKKWTLGARPADADAVYVLTAKNIPEAAGRADCIGGVRYPQRAFAVGEDLPYEGFDGLFYKNGTAKIVGHEIGHLMGAHHHYANCAQGTPGAVEEVGPTPCTLMFNFVDFMSLIFNNLEGSVVRGYALKHAAGGPDTDRIASSAVALTFENGIARGRVSSSAAACRNDSEIRLQRYAEERLPQDEDWVDHATGTVHAGAFRIKAPGTSGTLRALLPEQTFEDAQGSLVCAQASSAPRQVP